MHKGDTVAIYLRANALGPCTIDEQRRALTRLARAQGCHVAGGFVDGPGGAPAAEGAGLAALCALAEEKRSALKAVLVTGLDRLGRDPQSVRRWVSRLARVVVAVEIPGVEGPRRARGRRR